MSSPAHPVRERPYFGLLPTLPIGWAYIPLKRLISRNDGGAWGDDPTGDFDTIVLRSTEQTVDGRWAIVDPALRQLAKADAEATQLAAGDLLVTKSSGSSLHIGKTSLVDETIEAMRCSYSNFMQRLRPNQSLVPKYAWYFLNSDLARTQLSLTSTTSTGLANLNATSLGRVIVPTPSPEMQIRIAAHLDRITAATDSLIAEQERLIALLQEKRQAAISHAVTKGLSPNVPMKDSGVDWIGAFPEHWTVSTIKRVGSIRYGLGEPPPYREDGHPLVRATDVDQGTLALDTAVRVHEADIPAGRIVWLEPGDIIVVRSGAGTGDSGQYWGPSRTAIAGFDMVLRATRIDAAFLQWTLLASYVLKAQIDTLRMRAAQPHLNAQELGGCVLLVPPAEEQRQIAEFLHRSTQQLDEAASYASKAILLLRERRTALITAAVTGQIDVRGLVETAA